jgi:hypothetical protein
MIWFDALILSEAKLLFLSLNANLGIAEPDKVAHFFFGTLLAQTKLNELK